jgi:hypothetical protein
MVRSRTPKKLLKQRGRGPSRYKRSEATRLLKATTDAGLPVRGIEVDPITGVLRVLVGKPGEPSSGGNSWDEVLNAKDAKRSA